MAIDIFNIDDLEELRLKLIHRYEFLAYYSTGHNASGYVYSNSVVNELEELSNIGLIYANIENRVKSLSTIYYRLIASGQQLISKFVNTDVAAYYTDDYDKMVSGYSTNYSVTAMVKKMNMESDLRHLRNFLYNKWSVQNFREFLQGNSEFKRYVEVNLEFISGALDHLIMLNTGFKNIFTLKTEEITSVESHSHPMRHWLFYNYGIHHYTRTHNKNYSYTDVNGVDQDVLVDLGMDDWSGGDCGNWCGSPVWHEYYWSVFNYPEYKQVSDYNYDNATAFEYSKSAVKSSSTVYECSYHNRGQRASFSCNQYRNTMSFKAKPITRFTVDADVDYFLYCTQNDGDNPPVPGEDETDNRTRIALDYHDVSQKTVSVPAGTYNEIELGNLAEKMGAVWSDVQIEPNGGALTCPGTTETESAKDTTGYHDVRVGINTGIVLVKPNWTT